MAPVTARRCAQAFAKRHGLRRDRGIVTRAAAVEAPKASADEAAAAGGDMQAMYAQFEQLLEKTPSRFNRGDTVRGTVIDTDKKGALVDIGGKGAAFAPLQELAVAHVSDAAELLRPGMVREFTVIDDGNRSEQIALSMSVAEKAVMWQRLRQMQEEDITVQGTVVGANRGGVMVDVMNTRGFVPNSHLGGQSVDKDDIMGTALNLKFLEVDKEGQRVMLSARRAQSENDLTNFKIGDVVEGVVSKVTVYGAFLEVAQGVVGLLHISQISHDRITNIDKLLSVGDKLKVMIMSHDRERGRLALSTKKLEPTPGDMLKDPAIVFARADEMASLFKVRVQAAEQAARDEEARLQGASDPVAGEAAYAVEE